MFHRKVALRDANGNIVKWYGSSLDIDERKRAEEKVRLSEFILPKGSVLPTWEAGPSIPTASTIGLRVISNARTRSGQQTTWCSGIPGSSSPSAGTEVQLTVPCSVAFNSHVSRKGTDRGGFVESGGNP